MVGTNTGTFYLWMHLTIAGSTAQGVATNDNFIKIDWSDQNSYEALIEERLGSFNSSIPELAMEQYSMDDNWLAYSTMLTGKN